jgi:hypothetical protein
MHFHFEPHALLFLVFAIPFIYLKITKKENLFFINKKMANMFLVIAIFGLFGDTIMHSFFE